MRGRMDRCILQWSGAKRSEQVVTSCETTGVLVSLRDHPISRRLFAR